MYHFASLDYYEPMEYWEVEENTNINVVEEIKENYLWSFEYAEAHVNVLDEVPQSYSHKGNWELDQTKYTAKTQDHEYVDSEVFILFSRAYTFYEEERHAIMDCPFMSYHIKTFIDRHMELQIVEGTLMDQPHEHELGIYVIWNKLRGMELGSQLGSHSWQIHSFIQIKSK